MIKKIKRIKTGIQGLDPLIEGGIPQGYSVLLSGSVGTLKSIIGMQFLVNGFKESNQKGLFLTFEETKDNLFLQASQFRIDLENHHNKKEILVATIPTMDSMNESLVLKMINEAIEKHRIQRVVIDSLDTYANNILTFEDSEHKSSESLWTKRAVYSLLRKLQKFKHITKILIGEIDEKSDKLSRDGVSEFLSDGIIKLQYTSLGADRSRLLTIRKMRSTKNSADSFPVDITNKGVVIKS